VDCLCLEMVMSLEHGLRICRAAASTPLPLMMGITVRPGEGDHAGDVYLRDDPDAIPLAEVGRPLSILCRPALSRGEPLRATDRAVRLSQWQCERSSSVQS